MLAGCGFSLPRYCWSAYRRGSQGLSWHAEHCMDFLQRCMGFLHRHWLSEGAHDARAGASLRSEPKCEQGAVCRCCLWSRALQLLRA